MRPLSGKKKSPNPSGLPVGSGLALSPPPSPVTPDVVEDGDVLDGAPDDVLGGVLEGLLDVLVGAEEVLVDETVAPDPGLRGFVVRRGGSRRP